jgi:DNA repair exonuclease SbcCD nuclease subunit
MGEKRLASFLHMSDVHLGKRNTISNKDGRFGDFFKVFEDGVDIAIDRNTDFILISGDLFDSRQPSALTLELCEQILLKAKTSGIDVFCVEGNHDLRKITEKMSWIDYLQKKAVLIHLNTEYTEGNELRVSEYKTNTGKGTIFRHKSGLNIVGLGWLGLKAEEKAKALFDELEGHNNIIMLHAMLESFESTDYGIIRKEVFEPHLDKFTYVALGHGHTQKSYFDKLFNAGSTEYVEPEDFKNPKRGYYYVEVYQGNNGKFRVEQEHITSKKRDYLPIKIDVTDLDESNLAETLSKQIMRNWEDDIEEPLVDITLYGYAPALMNHRLPFKEVEEKVSQHKDFLTMAFTDDIDWYADSVLNMRTGNDGDSLSFDERCRIMMVETMVRVFDDGNSVAKLNPLIAEKLTDSLWDKFDDLKKGLSDDEKTKYLEYIHNMLWSEEQ